MSSRYRLLDRAVGGWLALVIALVCSSTAHSQDSPRVSEKAPTVEEQGHNETTQAKPHTSEFSIPVRLIENPSEADRAKEREARSDQHEADDLDAQQRAAAAGERSATASERQIIIAWWQLGLAVVGSIALFYTLWLTREMAKNAAEANRISRESIVSSQRAWLSIDRVRLRHPTRISDDGAVIVIEVIIKNVGQTPATSVWTLFEVIVPGDIYHSETPGIIDKNALMSILEKLHLRTHELPPEMGHIIFPMDTGTHIIRVTINKNRIDNISRLFDTGTPIFNLTLFVCVGYKIKGSDDRRLTQYAYGWYGVPMNFAVDVDAPIDLSSSRAQLHPSEAT